MIKDKTSQKIVEHTNVEISVLERQGEECHNKFRLVAVPGVQIRFDANLIIPCYQRDQSNKNIVVP